MDITRPAYWNVAGKELMFLVLAIQLAVLAYGIYRQFRRWRATIGTIRIARFDEVARRLRRVVAQALAQRRLLRERSAGLAHLSFSWGFALLFLGTIVAMLDEDFGIRVMRGAFYLWFQSLVLDLAGLLAIVGIVAMLWRRYVTKARRLREPADREQTILDACLPAGFLVILLTGFVIEGIRITVTHDPWGRWSPVGYAFSLALRGALASDAALKGLHAGLWWFHLVLASAFIAAIPYTKLAHIIAAPFNIFFAPIAPTLTPIDFEKVSSIGVSTPEGLTWKQALELETCTACGRCQAMCPVYAAGQPLSPKALILDLRDHVHGAPARPPVNMPATAQVVPTSAKTRQTWGTGTSTPSSSGELPPMIAAVSAEALWSCVTCGACVEACPVLIGHVPAIVDMRRYLVMEAANYPARLQGAMANLDARGHPYQGVSASRTAWARGLDIPRMAERGHADYLFWVGCASAFDERGQKVARAMATVLQRAGVDFAVLGDEESCCGDPARRIGDELLFQSCEQRIIETFAQYQFKALVTGCAHCFNSFKNEYPQLGGSLRVLHHTELMRELIRSGRLELGASVDELVTFHDPCYLGRYNGQYQAPRDVLRAIPGLRTTEMERNREASFCCGAGGGHNWMEEISGGRVSHARADQVLATGASIVATACAFCTPMLKDGLAVRNPAGGTQVLDVAEIVELATRGQARAPVKEAVKVQ